MYYISNSSEVQLIHLFNTTIKGYAVGLLTIITIINYLLLTKYITNINR